MEVEMMVERNELKELDCIDKTIGNCGDKHVIPNVESLATAVIMIVDQYMSVNKGEMKNG